MCDSGILPLIQSTDEMSSEIPSYFAFGLCGSQTRGTVCQYHKETRHEPDYVKSNLSEEEIQPGQWSQQLSSLWVTVNMLEFARRSFNSSLIGILWTHHMFCSEHAVGYTFPSRRLSVVAPTICRIDCSVWIMAVWPAIVLKGSLLLG